MASVCFSICVIADVKFDCWGTAWDNYNLGLQNLIRELLYTIAVFGKKQHYNTVTMLVYYINYIGIFAVGNYINIILVTISIIL